MMPLSGDKGAGKKGANSEKSLGPPLQLRKELSRERGWGTRELQVGPGREKMRLAMLCSQSTPGRRAPGGPHSSSQDQAHPPKGRPPLDTGPRSHQHWTEAQCVETRLIRTHVFSGTAWLHAARGSAQVAFGSAGCVRPLWDQQPFVLGGRGFRRTRPLL